VVVGAGVLSVDANQVRLVALVALGGAIGTVARYGVSGWLSPGPFPWGTFAVNFTGTFLLAVLFFFSAGRGYLPPDVRTFLFIGVFGGYTTYSTFGLETTSMLRAGELGSATLNILLNGGVCLVGAVVGAMIGAGLGGV
jgi:fluoride exporter